MPVALDATYSLGSELSGVGVYCREILHGLAALHSEEKFRWCYRPHRYLAGRHAASAFPNCDAYLMHDRWRVPRDRVFHGLNQRMPARGGVCTFHDLFVMTGDYSTPEFRERFTRLSREAADQADLIIAVSQFTADQVHELLGVERSRLRVVHHGVTIGSALSLPREPIVLHVGVVQARKNVGRLIQAFEIAAPPHWRLVLAGAVGYGGAEILERVRGNARVECTGFVSNAELASLYARASVFAFPSLDEGFGMPVLEAMARGVPVITTNRSALPEVAGDAALLVDPLSLEEMADGLRRMIEDEKLRRELVILGATRASEFSWKKAVKETWGVYKEL